MFDGQNYVLKSEKSSGKKVPPGNNSPACKIKKNVEIVVPGEVYIISKSVYKMIKS